MGTICIQYFKTPLGELILGGFEWNLCLCDWRLRKNRASVDTRIREKLHAEFIEKAVPVTDLAKIQLEEYFGGRRKAFDLPLLMVGTSFQKKVWEELLKISYGKTTTYASLSEKMNNRLGIRAIAAANSANALAIIIPCHRVIGTFGDLVGYSGGLHTKKKLLQLERSWKGDQLELFG